MKRIDGRHLYEDGTMAYAGHHAYSPLAMAGLPWRWAALRTTRLKGPTLGSVMYRYSTMLQLLLGLRHAQILLGLRHAQILHVPLCIREAVMFMTQLSWTGNYWCTRYSCGLS